MLCWPGRSRGVEQGLDDEIDKVTGSESAMPEKDDGREKPDREPSRPVCHVLRDKLGWVELRAKGGGG